MIDLYIIPIYNNYRHIIQGILNTNEKEDKLKIKSQDRFGLST